MPYTLRLGYDYWPADHVLRARHPGCRNVVARRLTHAPVPLQTLLPASVDVPTSFETVGHVAHLNLRDEALPYRHLIGRVLLEKNAGRIRTVLNKVPQA